MTISTWMHGVTSINLTPIACMENKVTETEFYTRDLVINMADRKSFAFTLFSNDGHTMLVDDPDLASIQSAEIKES